MHATKSGNEIIAALREASYHFTCEAELQEGIAQRLTACGIDFEREVRLSATDRIDFLCGPVGVEIKIQGSVSAVTRQLFQYAQSPRIWALVLVTSRSQHRAVAMAMNGKPVLVLHLPNL